MALLRLGRDAAGKVRPVAALAWRQPGVWASALATLVVLAMLATLLLVVVGNAVVWFWPAPIWRIELADGEVRLGQLAGGQETRAASATGATADSASRQLRIKVGNRELTGRDFVWINEAAVRHRSRPGEALRVIRTDHGDAFGRVVGARAPDGEPIAGPVAPARLDRLLADGAALRERADELDAAMRELRRPQTRLEGRLEMLRRSARRDTPGARAELRRLETELAALAPRLEPRLAELRRQRIDVAAQLATGGVTLAVDGAASAGAGTLTVPLEEIVDLAHPNRMGSAAKAWWAVRAAVRFLLGNPRDGGQEGGIFPAILGTVLLVMIMSVAVMPLGVVTAVYMTEYARDGIVLRLANLAVTNLAGIPSIVFGMFGLAFFIYGAGGVIDRMLFADRLPAPTYGTGGILWASLTLALLTVPSVVVATREGLRAVPRSWRDGALALGATRWQSLRRIILPAATPGILTGFILAVSRAAGEVAPLMLTGAVKLAPAMVLDGSPPYLHLERKLMHLGFHIYDISMQSPNVEAAKPVAFATTLVLLLLVVGMNLTAIVLRRRLRHRYRGEVVQ